MIKILFVFKSYYDFISVNLEIQIQGNSYWSQGNFQVIMNKTTSK